MASIDTKMSVTGLSQYKNAMNQAAQSVKTLDAQLKQNEAQYKASGDREKYMSQQAKLLEDKLKAQKAAAKSAQDALKQMKAQGVDPMNQSYQKFAQQLAQAETSVLETSAAINSLGQSEQEAAKGADQLSASVQGISKKISLDQVINGVNRITTGLENAAKKAVELGKAITDAIMDSAARGDNIATMASILGMDVESYQAYQKVFDTVADITVRDWRMAQNKIKSAMTSPNAEQLSVLQFLGISTSRLADTGGGILEPVEKDVEEVFWDIGERIRQKVASGEITMLKADDLASAIFGNKYENLNPLFDNFTRETFQAALDAQTVVDEESVKKLASLNDELIKLQGDFQSLQDQILAGMAPALEGAAKALDSLLGKLMEYLQKPEGQAMLERLGEAVSGIFEDLSNIDPESVVNNFVTVFNKLVEGFEWIEHHWTDVENGIKGIAAAFGLLKVSETVLTFMQVGKGVKDMLGFGTGGGGGATVGGLGGVSGKLLATGAGVGLTTAAATAASALTAFDPTGLTAMLPAVISDHTAIGRTLRNGGTLAEAAEAEAKGVEQAMKNAVKAWEDWGNQIINVPKQLAQSLWKDLFGGGNEEPTAEIKVEPKTDEEAAAEISAQIGTVSVPVVLKLTHAGGSAFGGGGGGLQNYFMDTLFGSYRPGRANGLPFVPFDGYITSLHRGERVLTAQQNRNYTFNNNTYFSGVNLHNGLEVDALTNSIADRQARQAAAYGAN